MTFLSRPVPCQFRWPKGHLHQGRPGEDVHPVLEDLSRGNYGADGNRRDTAAQEDLLVLRLWSSLLPWGGRRSRSQRSSAFTRAFAGRLLSKTNNKYPLIEKQVYCHYKCTTDRRDVNILACSLVLLRKVHGLAQLGHNGTLRGMIRPSPFAASASDTEKTHLGQEPLQSPAARPQRSEGGTFLAATSTRFLAESAGLKRGTSSQGKPAGGGEGGGKRKGVALEKPCQRGSGARSPGTAPPQTFKSRWWNQKRQNHRQQP